MRRLASMIAALAVLICLSEFPLLAQRQAGQGPGGTNNPEPNHPGMNTTQAPDTNDDPGIQAQQGPAGVETPAGENAQQPGSSGIGSPTGENTRQGIVTPMVRQKTPSELLAENNKLVSELQPLLPRGIDIPSAAKGFDSLDDFMAAVHVSHNLGIPFGQLKTKAINKGSLDKAVQELKPDMDHKSAKSQVKVARKQAKQDVKGAKS